MQNPWLAFVPILNAVLMCAMIDVSLWYVLLFFIPIVSLIWSVYVWMKICELMGLLAAHCAVPAKRRGGGVIFF